MAATLVEEFRPGNVAFIKQALGITSKQIGDEPTQILIVLNSGHYQQISISSWLGGNPPSMIADNLVGRKKTGCAFAKRRRWDPLKNRPAAIRPIPVRLSRYYTATKCAAVLPSRSADASFVREHFVRSLPTCP